MKLFIKGAIMGGKNHINITRTGHRYPSRSWAEWRDKTVAEFRKQLPDGFTMITKPCEIDVLYTPYDKRIRDTPAMLDAIYHCLEKAGIVENDFLIKNVSWKEFSGLKKDAGVDICIEEF